MDAGHEQLGVEGAACLQRGLGQPQQMFTHQYTEQLSENLACVGAHAALGTLEEGRSHPCAPFHLSLVGFLPQALPRAAHPNPIPALPIPLIRQEPRDLPVQAEPFSMTRLAAHRRDLFPCKGHAGTPNPLIPCKTPANLPRARTCRSCGRCDTRGQPPSPGSCLWVPEQTQRLWRALSGAGSWVLARENKA